MRGSIRVGFLALIAAALPLASAQAADLCSNTNSATVQDNPPNHHARCQLARPAHITQLYTYHWHNGAGAAPGTITLSDPTAVPPRSWGPFQATGSPAAPGGPIVNWTANVGIDVPAGNYLIVDSDLATWSWNQGSNNDGFAIVRGDYTATPAPVAANERPNVDCMASCNAPGGATGFFTLSCSAHGPHSMCTPAMGSEANAGPQVSCTDGISTTVCRCLTVIGVGISPAGCTTR